MEFSDLSQAEVNEMDIIQAEMEQDETEEEEEENMQSESLEDPDKLDYEEIAEMREAFNIFDRNQSGTIDAFELGNVMRVLRYDPTEEQVQAFLNVADITGDNVIDFKEFVLMIRKNKHKMGEDKLLKAFKVFDRDNNGLIDEKELAMILTSLDPSSSVTTEQINEMIKDADLNKDGFINYQELAKYWKCT